MMQASRQLKYLVLKPFRFAGRGYEPGDEFNARRADPRMGRLRQWCEDGVLGLPGDQPEPQPDAPEGEQEPDAAPEEGDAEGDEDAPDPEGEQE